MAEKKRTVQLEPMSGPNGALMAIRFPYDPELMTVAKELGAIWSQEKKTWYMPAGPDKVKLAFEAYRGKAWVDYSAMKNAPGKEVDPPKQALTQKPLIPKEYLLKLERLRYSPNTIKAYAHMLSAFIAFHPGRELDSLNEDDIHAFMDSLVAKKLSASHQNQAVNAIKFHFEKVLGRPRIVHRIDRPKKGRRLPNVLSEEEVKKILDVPMNSKHKAMLMLVYSAGLRSGELLALRPQDLDRDRMLLRITDTVVKIRTRSLMVDR